ncbi:ribonuclease H-like domain-containing protein [Tanacetum coccineum]
MTGSPNPPVILLSDKLLTVHNLTTLVPVKLDVDKLNYSSWVYYFKNLCKDFEVLNNIIGEFDEATTNTTMSPTPEWLKIDSIVLSWIFMTLSETLQERLNDKYENVDGIIVHREPFPDIKTARSMLTTKEMRLKSKSQALHIDSSSSYPMILLAESGNNTRCSTVGHVKSNKPCFNFAKGFYRFGDNCKFVHGGTYLLIPSGTDLLISSGTDLLTPSGTDLFTPSRTDLLIPLGTDLLILSGTYLLIPSGTDLLTPSGTDLLIPSGTDLLIPSGTDLLIPSKADILVFLRNRFIT